MKDISPELESRPQPNSITEPAVKSNSLEIGIGRTAAMAWVKEFAEAFNSTTPKGVGLVLRQTPSVSYVAGADLCSLEGIDYKGPGSEDEARDKVGSLIRTLAADGAIKPQVAIKALPTRVEGFLTSTKNGRKNIRAKLSDIPTSAYPKQGFALEGERLAIIEGLGLNLPPQPQKEYAVPQQNLMLGYIEDRFNLLTKTQLSIIGAIVSKEVELLPLSVVSLSYVDQ